MRSLQPQHILSLSLSFLIMMMIHCANFNQEGSLFGVALESGFRVYSCDPCRLSLDRSQQQQQDEEEKMHECMNASSHAFMQNANSLPTPLDPSSEEGFGIGQIELLGRTNYIGLLGGGTRPRYAPSRAVLWDEAQGGPALSLEFRSTVRGLRLRRDRLVVLLQRRALVYTLTLAPTRLHAFETCDNEKGIAALCTSPSCALLALPGERVGHIHLIDLARTSGSLTILAAHEHALAHLAFNATGSRLASASVQGTLIRVYDTETGRLCAELRRGSDAAEIHSIAFNATSTRLAVSSDKGTVHLFGLESDECMNTCIHANATTDSNHANAFMQDRDRSSLTKDLIKDYLPKYFSSQWSYAQIKLPDLPSSIPVPHPSPHLIVAFGPSDQLHILNTRDALFYTYQIAEPHQPSSECIKQSQIAFLQMHA